jgi:hypothetical protein
MTEPSKATLRALNHARNMPKWKQALYAKERADFEAQAAFIRRGGHT